MSSTSTSRDYDTLAEKLAHEISPTMSREERMQIFVDIMWEGLNESNVSWIGFYVKNTDGDDMILGPRRDKPACSPIAMFGACGKSFSSCKGLIVTNVANLRAGYIACDPRDKSELVIPLLEAYDLPYGVLDVDSYSMHAFDQNDAFNMHKLLRIAGLTADLALGVVETV